MTLVFGTNLQADSHIFADVAALLAQRMQETLRLVHVAEDPRAPIVLGTDEEHILGEIRGRLQEEAQRLQDQSGASVQAHLAAGPVPETLASIAEFELARLLIVGSRSRRSSHLLGDTAERVSRKSFVPVLTLREAERLMAWLQGQKTLRMLIGADLGHAATAARDFAGKLARLAPCAIEIIHVVSPDELQKRLGVSPSLFDHGLTAELEAHLLNELRRAAPPSETEVTLRVILARGSPDAFLVTLAEQEEFDLMLVGQRQQSLLSQFWSGSVSRGVIRSAPVSVISVASPPESLRPGVQPYRTIVAATDFSRASDQALHHASGLISADGIVHLAYVIPPVHETLDARDAQQQAWSTLSKISLPESSKSQTIQRHVLEGEPAEQLLMLAERVSADLIVLGTQNRPSVSRTLLGSVAREITEKSRMPVLIVPFGIP